MANSRSPVAGHDGYVSHQSLEFLRQRGDRGHSGGAYYDRVETPERNLKVWKIGEAPPE